MGRFRIDPSITGASTNNQSASVLASGSQSFKFRVHPNPTSPVKGSFQSDLDSGKFQKRWETLQDFDKWLSDEQRRLAIELRLVNTDTRSDRYTQKRRFVCSRAGTGGKKTYVKIHPEWTRKREGKRTDCGCSLIVKNYPGVSIVLGKYNDAHNHALGNANLRYTQIPKETREYIAGLLRLKVTPEHILHLIHRGVYDSDALFEGEFDGDAVAARTEFIQLRDIRRIEKDIEAETVRLNPDDGLSTLQWVRNLEAKGHLLGFKSKSDTPPPGSGLDRDVFTLMVQTDWQRCMFKKHGAPLLCIDATHNTTMYDSLNLTTLVVRDKWAHGT
ncbi:hypothetical protein B0H15DRAFT_777313 [Mycena belliarum]|uniref:FAR1 domain-containing protein n=1 Tax=Mycena belliarum TaxID=1033014 RepID=A0AAD6XNZ1_9AGAR|nr:hypothetical protein B0H15DRAFT_777313 [Mycena belliae]